jgi:Cyclopropane fatty acid synthase and related methyltransferases
MPPVLYQPGTSANWTPSSPEMVQAILDLAELCPYDLLLDLGSGDGRLVIEAAKRGVRAIGIEDNLELFELARTRAKDLDVPRPPTFRIQNLLEVDLSIATVITCFLDRPIHKQLLRKFATLEKGVRVISNTFHLWEHDAETTVKDDPEFHTCRLWRVS